MGVWRNGHICEGSWRATGGRECVRRSRVRKVAGNSN
jgi:hypothetical protein